MVNVEYGAEMILQVSKETLKAVLDTMMSMISLQTIQQIN